LPELQTEDRDMNFIAETLTACRIDRIVDLRRRLFTEPNPLLREKLEADLGEERRGLALLLASDDQDWDWFYVRRDEHGTLSLHLRRVCLPVNSPYVEHLLGELKVAVPPNGLAVVSPAFAMDAIEEALAQVNHDLAVAGDLRRRLAYFHRIAETFASETGDEKACA
jgi:hypothetical protein